jgi:hypothetical protein
MVLKIIVLVALSLAVVVAAAAATGLLRWERATARDFARLTARSQSARGARFSPGLLNGVPGPVARYFAFALTPGQPLIQRAEIRHSGQFAMEPEAWSPFKSTEVFVVQPPAFLWDATIRMAGIVPVRVHDSYVGGEGALHAAIAGLLTVANQHGTPEMAAGELLRFLAEAVWLPTALLAGPNVRWDGIDDASARVTLRDGAIAASLEVCFGPRGEITGVSAERPRAVGNTTVLTRWVGSFADYANVEHMQVPMTGEVGWEMAAGFQPYWRGRIERASYVFEP